MVTQPARLRHSTVVQRPARTVARTSLSFDRGVKVPRYALDVDVAVQELLDL